MPHFGNSSLQRMCHKAPQRPGGVFDLTAHNDTVIWNRTLVLWNTQNTQEDASYAQNTPDTKLPKQPNRLMLIIQSLFAFTGSFVIRILKKFFALVWQFLAWVWKYEFQEHTPSYTHDALWAAHLRQSIVQKSNSLKKYLWGFLGVLFVSFLLQSIHLGYQVHLSFDNVLVKAALSDQKRFPSDPNTLLQEASPLVKMLNNHIASGDYFYGTPSYSGLLYHGVQMHTALNESYDAFAKLQDMFARKKGNQDLTKLTSQMRPAFISLMNNMAPLGKNAQAINVSLLPDAYQKIYTQVQKKLSDFEEFRPYLSQNFDLIMQLLGSKSIQRTLVLLQNSSEIRPTGGFIGSFVQVDMLNGDYELHPIDVYHYDGQLSDHIKPPYGLRSVSKNFYMRDANYWPHFPKSVQKIMWFYEKSGGPSIDHMVAINQRIIPEILEVTGPIDIPKYGITVTKDNYYYHLVANIESKQTATHTPKQILFDLIDQIQKRFLDMSLQEKYDLINHVWENAQIQAYSQNQKFQNVLRKMGVAGLQYTPKEREDFVQVVHTSISGNKSDYYIDERYMHHTEIDDNGDMTSTLTINRRHTWDASQRDKWRQYLPKWQKQNENMYFIFGDGENRSFVRVYLPKDAQIHNVLWVDPGSVGMNKEGDHLTVFFELSLIPGDQKRVRIRYSLPHSYGPGDPYTFAMQKQAGMPVSEVHKSVKCQDCQVQSMGARSAPNIKREFELSKDIQKFLFYFD